MKDYLVQITEEELEDLREHSKKILKLHDDRDNCGTRYIHDRKIEELTGLVGQFGFSKWYWLPMDWALRPKGDGGKDFDFHGKIISVKSSQNPVALRLKDYEPRVWLHVLAGVSKDFRTVRLLGWEFDYLMRRIPRQTMSSGIMNHIQMTGQLNPMDDLEPTCLGQKVWDYVCKET